MFITSLMLITNCLKSILTDTPIIDKWSVKYCHMKHVLKNVFIEGKRDQR